MEIFDDLEAELAQLEAMLASLSDEQWLSPSGATGWSVADVVLHLAQSEESIPLSASITTAAEWSADDTKVDDLVDQWVQRERDEPFTVFERWKVAHRRSVTTLRAANTAHADRKIRWAAAPLKPATLATTRIAEHWAHALDIAVPLALDYPDTDRLRHVAWLGYSTLPYAFGLAGIEPQPVFVELSSPHGETWTFGSPSARTQVRGTASDFCRVGARRLSRYDSGLAAVGPLADRTLELLRNYAL